MFSFILCFCFFHLKKLALILYLQIPYMSGGLHLMDFLLHEDNIKSVLVLGRLSDHLMDYLIGNYEVSKLNLDCEVCFVFEFLISCKLLLLH